MMSEPVRRGLLRIGMPLVIAATTLPYSTDLTDYMIPKTAAIFAGSGLMFCLLVVIWVLDRAIRLVSFPVHLPMLAFAAVSTLSMLLAQNRMLALEVLSGQLGLLVLCLVVANCVRDCAEIVRILRWVCLTGQAVILFGLLQYFGIHLIPHPASFGNHAISTLGNPNFVAHYLCLLLPVAVALLLRSRSIWTKAWLTSTVLGGSFYLLITRSRSGWVVAALAVLFVLFFARRQISLRPLLVKTALVVALLGPAAWLASREISLGSGERLYTRFEHIAGDAWQRAQSALDRKDFSIVMRRIIWTDTLDLIRSRPWLGTGPGNYELHLPAHRSVSRHREWSALMEWRPHVAYRAHSEYLESAAEIGVVGLAAFLWLMGSMVRAGRVAIRNSPSEDMRLVALGCLAAMVGLLVHSLFSFNLQDPTAATHFYLFAGLLLAVNRNDLVVELKKEDLSRLARLVLVVCSVGVLIGGLYRGLCLVAGDHYYLQGLGSYMQHGHANRAKLAFERAIAWRDYDYRYHRMLGQVELAMRRNENAEKALRTSLQLHPNNAPVLDLMGETLYRLGRIGAAEELMRTLTRLRPLDAESYRLLALARRDNGKHLEAVDAWKQALSFRREDSSLVRSLGVEYAQAGKLEEARNVLEGAAMLQPDDGLIRGNLGGIYLGLGQYEEAKESLVRALRLAPDNTSQWLGNLAQVHLALGAFAAAMEAVETALATDPGNEKLTRLKQRIQLEKGTYE